MRSVLRREGNCGTGRPVSGTATVMGMMFVLSVLWSICVSAETLAALLPSAETVKGWQMQGAPREFVPKNLWQYIDGQADMYISYGFVKVETAVYQRGQEAQKTITVDIYDMGSPLGAFGVYAQMDSGDVPSAGVGASSYVLAPSLAFYKSRYFVLLNAGWGGGDAEAPLREFAQQVEAKLPGDNSAPSEALLLPLELRTKLKGFSFSLEGSKVDLKAPRGAKRLPGTLRYIPQSLLGHEFLPGGVEAEYKVGEEKLKLFIAFFKTPDDAAKGFGAYKKYVGEKGKAVTDTLVSEAKGFSAEEPYQGNVVIAQYDKWLVGATHLKAADDGKSLVEQLLAILKKK